MSDIETLTCPKCAGSMRRYERNGVVVDQCTECRGIFLDRGELERLVEAEGAHYADQGSGERFDDRDRYEGSEKRESSGRKRRRGSFLENLFDSD